MVCRSNELARFSPKPGCGGGDAGWSLWNENSLLSIVNKPVQTGEGAASLSSVDANSVHGILCNLTSGFSALSEGYYAVNLKASVYKVTAFDGNLEFDVAYWDATGQHKFYLNKITPDKPGETWLTETNTFSVIKIEGHVDSAMFENYTWGGSGTSSWTLDDVSLSLNKILAPATPSGLAQSDTDFDALTLNWVNGESDNLEVTIILLDGDSLTTTAVHPKGWKG